LSYLHGHALVHRDLKLDNVLAFDRHCHLVKLGDFGLTRVTGWQVSPAPGPAPYAPPELRAHLRPGEAGLRLEPAVDTWAFGVLLFALLTGTFPWASPEPSDPAFRRFRAWHGRTCSTGELRAGLPRTWRGLGGAALEMLRGLMHPEPARRSPPGEVNRYLRRRWAGRGGARGRPAGEGGQVRSAGEGGQVNSEDGQVSSAGENGSAQVSTGSGQVSSAGENWSGQVRSAGERGSGQVSSESGQVSPESGQVSYESGQVSSAGESGQVSPESDQVNSESGQVRMGVTREPNR
ncbi:serine/threonine-protein kinase SBK1-like, partial [Malurus melanocephalus]|uniref:serine/threonine-protein kinase SBK1-like n=1 Tax=Malurus melanocephalus TaxID=175006 RepID=UPI0025481D98